MTVRRFATYYLASNAPGQSHPLFAVDTHQSMSTHSVLALRNILRSDSPPQDHFVNTDPAQMSSSSSSSAAAADHDPALAPSSSSHNLKRLASPTFEGLDGDSRKRVKTNGNSADADTDLPQTNPALANATQAVALSAQPTPSSALLDDLEQELLCGCCSALLYRPVIVLPCEHYFCGRFVPFHLLYHCLCHY